MRSLLLLTAAIFAVALADLPEKCKKPPKGPAEGCCEGFKEFITPEIFKGCGFESIAEGNLPPCEAFVCMLKNIGVIGADKKIDRTKVKNVLNEKYSGEWSAMGNGAAEKCFDEVDRLKTPCEAQSFAMCFVKNSVKGCPEKKWKNTKECIDAKVFLVECAEELM